MPEVFGLRACRVIACAAVVVMLAPSLPAQVEAPPASLQITILDGNEAINNIRQRTAREPIIQVEDENHRPITGAAVIFLLPNDGPGATFLNGARSLSVVTDSKGQAIARGLRPNNVAGHYQIRVDASYRGVSARATVSQSNVAASAAVVAGLSAKLLIGIGIAAGVATGAGIYLSSRGNNTTGGAAANSAGIVLTPGTGSVGPPH